MQRSAARVGPEGRGPYENIYEQAKLRRIVKLLLVGAAVPCRVFETARRQASPCSRLGVAGVESDLQIGQKETLPMASGREPIQTVRAGLMSGTSMDGVDVAIIETDGQEIVTLSRTGFFPYAEADRTLLRRAAGDAALLEDRNAGPGCLALAEAMITSRHAEAVEAFLAAESIDRAAVDLIGFHGQTVLHRPGRRLTVQIDDGAGLAARLGIRVIHDFRAADVAQGGQGRRSCPCFTARSPPRRGFWSRSHSSISAASPI
jgi:hypothetical protein